MPTPDAPTAAALTAVQRTWAFTYKAVAADAVTELRDLTVESCTVQNNDLADTVKRTCSVKLAGSSTFNQLTELFRPYVSLTVPGGGVATWCLGTFYLSSGSSRALAEAGSSSRDFSGYDTLLALDEDKLTDRYVANAGFNAVSDANYHLGQAGFATGRRGILPSSKLLVAPMEWEPGTSRLKIINDLLSAVGYRSLYVDELGVARSEPYTDPASAPVVWAYAPDANSVIRPGVDVTLDLFQIPNRWVAYVSEPDRPPLTSTYTNSNPASPTSTVNRGRTITEVVQLQQGTGDAPPVDQATLDAKVLQLARESSQVYSDSEFTTGLMPFHGTGEVFTLDIGTGPVRYREHTWELPLQVGGVMKHRFRRVVAI